MATQHLHDKLTSLRTQKGLSQRQAAELTEIKQSQIARWESGVVSPTTKSLYNYVRALGYQLEINFVESKENEHAN